MKYVYTAVFTPVDGGGYTVSVPDLPGCITDGVNLTEALEMIQDAGTMWLWDAENKAEAIPGATPLEDVVVGGNETKSLVLFDTDAYPHMYNGQMVCKDIEDIVKRVDSNFRLSGMPLTVDDKDRIRACLSGKTSFKAETESLIRKYTVKELK